MQARRIHLSSEPPRVQTVHLQVPNKPKCSLEILRWVSLTRADATFVAMPSKALYLAVGGGSPVASATGNWYWVRPAPSRSAHCWAGGAAVLCPASLGSTSRHASCGYTCSTSAYAIQQPCPPGYLENTASKCALLGVHTLVLRLVLL